jgi:outer membrane protein
MRIGKIDFTFGKKSLSLALLACLFLAQSSAQTAETWSLQRCIEYARDNSLTLKQAQYGVEMAKLTDKQNVLARLPNINGSTTGGMQFGRTIDPTENSFVNQRITFNSFGINANLVLYSGGRINNTIKQGKVDVDAAQADGQTSFNNIAVSIANTYLQILMSQEQLENATKRRDLSARQLEQTDKLIQAGTIPANDRLDVLARIARDEQTIIQAQNAIDINYLNLKELMQLDPATPIRIERPAAVIPADADPDGLTFRETYSSALNTQPQIRRDELRLRSAELDVDIAKSALLPTVTLFGGIDTRWSSASKVVVGSVADTFVQEVIIDQTPITVKYPGESFILDDNPYFDQLDQNFGQNFGVNVSVPIYNNGRNKINVQRAQVGILNARIQSDLTKQQLKIDVQNAIASARAAKRSYEAGLKSVEAARVAYENAEKRFNLGVINNLQLLTARNAFDIADTELIVAKYDYLFRLKILDFYLGRELRLD